MRYDAPYVDRSIADVPNGARIRVRSEMRAIDVEFFAIPMIDQSRVVSSLKTLNSTKRPSLRIICMPRLTIGA